ncbi:MAG TPA: porin [bacterium]|nr:porin [bacterium]HOL35122.1 porin [bacterium]HPP07821.1 porin [bacterium]
MDEGCKAERKKEVENLITGRKSMEEKELRKRRAFINRIRIMFCSLVMFTLTLIPVNKAHASKEEMYILLNLLVQKGVITAEESKEMLAAVENITKKQKEDSAKNSIKTSAADNIKIGGYLQGRYDVYDYSGKRDEFSIKRARIGLSGKVIDNVTFKIEFDATKGKDNDLLTDAWIKLAYFPQFNITLGQFKLPFSEEYNISSSAIDTIERSLPVNSMATEYDKGIMFDGNFANGKIYYGVSLTNGTGGNKSEDNDDKDVTGRIVFAPWAGSERPASGLKFGYGYQTGKQDTGANQKDRTRNDFMLKYDYKNFKLLTEYIDQEEKAVSSTTKKNGWFVQCAYNIPLEHNKSIEPVVKYEVYDPNTKVSKNTQTIFTAGFNLYLNKLTKISTNYRWRNDDQGGSIASNKNEWFTQLQIKF